MWLVVGLGNPGAEYANTRHNIGAIAVERWAQSANEKLKRTKQAQALTASVRVADQSVVLAFPQTFMNASGAAVSGLAKFYKVDVDHIIVLHDELDIAFGTIRLKLGGGDNGHNGLRSIRSAMGGGEWYRARLGIGRPPGLMDPAAFVLRQFRKEEAKELDDFCIQARLAVESLIAEGLATAQGRFNQ